MTDATLPVHAPAAPHGHPPAEEDVVPAGKIATVGVVALVVFFLGSVAAGLGMVAMQREVNPEGPPPLPSQLGQAKIGIVEQRLFENANQGVAWRARAQRQLGSTGWVDRQKGVVHIPIDEAMELVVKGARP